MFAARGWVNSAELTKALRADLAELERAVWLRGNSFLLERAARSVDQ